MKFHINININLKFQEILLLNLKFTLNTVNSIIEYKTISNNILVNNCIFFSYIMSMITINPLTYKLFGIPFNNYKTFN